MTIKKTNNMLMQQLEWKKEAEVDTWREAFTILASGGEPLSTLRKR